MEGFISAGVPPYVIISAVREWLQEQDNATAYSKVVFSMPASPANSSLMERYFPLEDNRRDIMLQVRTMPGPGNEANRTIQAGFGLVNGL